MILNFSRTRSPGGSSHEIGDSWTPSSERLAATHRRTRLGHPSFTVPRLIDTRVGSLKGHYVNLGSIPARAGEPSGASCSWAAARVYPRACGGTIEYQVVHWTGEGLSPRVRGNRVHAGRLLARQRSIPARAGEPSPWAPRFTPTPVYPRACGGTLRNRHAVRLPGGLSPRVRGNPHVDGVVGVEGGSIPARAGEPRPKRSGRYHNPVYPRACGGTRPTRPRQTDA